MQKGLEEKPGDPAILYNFACLEARAGKPDAALDLLLAAVDADERFREYAQTAEDFESFRDDPRFPR
jgi:thioredoxin-like negative regulator of GroEL